MNNISIVVSAFNEEKNIEKCLESVRELANEIVVVDNESKDRTAEIAKNLGALVFERPNDTMLNKNKNFGFTKATGEWILNLDADEEVSFELQDEIKNVLGDQRPETKDYQPLNGYWIPRKNLIFGKWIKHSLWWPDKQLRLFRKGKGKFPEEHIHEYLKVEGETAHLKNPLIHNNYTSISQFLYKLDKIYTENEAEYFLKKGNNITWQDSLKWPTSDFLKTYFAQRGYKDGLHGLVLSILQALYAEVKFGKIWEKQGFKDIEINPKEMLTVTKKMLKEIEYWLISTEIEETKDPLKKLALKLKRKLR